MRWPKAQGAKPLREPMPGRIKANNQENISGRQFENGNIHRPGTPAHLNNIDTFASFPGWRFVDVGCRGN
jgi:hypothetical protein